MVYSKFKKILIILLCCFVLIFPFWCVRGLCAEVEEVEFSTVSGLSIVNTRNYFSTGAADVGYALIERGYKYKFTNNSSSAKNLAYSDDIPVMNGTYNYIIRLLPGESYEFISNSNEYLYFDFSSSSSASLTREKITGMSGTIEELASTVGPNALWNIFDISINYIVVVVLVAFGIYIIIRLIKRIQKGKGGV